MENQVNGSLPDLREEGSDKAGTIKVGDRTMRANIILEQMLTLLAMMTVGYYLYKIGWINDGLSEGLSRIVVNIFNPVLVIKGVLGQRAQGDEILLLQNLLLIVLYFGIVTAAGLVIPVVLRVKRRRKSLYQMMSVFGNIGFMGIPVIQNFYGNEAGLYVAFYLLAYNVLLYTYGVLLAERASGSQTGRKRNGFRIDLFKRMLNPGVLSAVSAIMIFVLKPAVPMPVTAFCEYMGNTTIPLSMILIGVSTAQTDMREVFGEWRIYCFILIRMVLLPLTMIWLLPDILPAGMELNAIVFGVFIIELSMPVGSCIALIAKDKGADMDCCMKGVVLSTVASVITIPIIGIFL